MVLSKRRNQLHCTMACSVLGAALSVVLAGSASAQTTITVFSRWGAAHNYTRALESAFASFQKQHPDLSLKMLSDKTADAITSAVAAGTPPDVVFVSEPVHWAIAGLIQPLDSFARASGIVAGDYVPPAFRRGEWDGHRYSMPFIVDPDFALVWNEALFSQAGLDPVKGPATIPELDAYIQRLTKVAADGGLTQLGMIPWNVFGPWNALVTWGWAFGGHFYDAATHRITADDPNVVDALTWMRDWNQKYAGAYPGLAGQARQATVPFSNGLVAMELEHSTRLKRVRGEAPSMQLGLSFTPYNPVSGQPNPAWVGGWDLAVPTGAQHPKEAWEFIQYVTATADGTLAAAKVSGGFPALASSPAFAFFREDPLMSPFINILLTARNVFPGLPVNATFASEGTKAINDVFAGKSQPHDALEHVTEVVQKDLDQALSAIN